MWHWTVIYLTLQKSSQDDKDGIEKVKVKEVYVSEATVESLVSMGDAGREKKDT